MNINLKIKSDEKCYSYSEYVIKVIDGRKFVAPSENAKRRKENVAVNIKTKFLELMKIGKRAFFNGKIKDAEILEYVNKYGLLGIVLNDLMNKLEVETGVDIRSTTIFTKDYIEPVDMIVFYAESIYEMIYKIEMDYDYIAFPEILNDRYIVNDYALKLGEGIGIIAVTLKYAIDKYFIMLLAEPTRRVRICKNCNNVFIANNVNEEYCKEKCKNHKN